MGTKLLTSNAIFLVFLKIKKNSFQNNKYLKSYH